MNWQHVTAFVWLRWRLISNQLRRAGDVNAMLMTIVTVGALVTAVPLFIFSLILGVYLIPHARPMQLMYAWDGLVVAFLFFWGIGLIAELQKSEPLSLAKFLHLPVSVNGAFLINYLSSLVRLSPVVLGPAMLGFSLALVATKGILLLPVLPLLAALLLMITALSYQFQGWLASMMNNPRRRRTVVMAVTVIFVLLFQAPNFLNVWFVSSRAQEHAARSAHHAEEMAKQDRALQAKEIDVAEYMRRQQELKQTEQRAREQAAREHVARREQLAKLVNLVLPIGWLPLGVLFAAEGRVLPSLLGVLGMTLIGTASLWRAYRATVRLYQGQSTNRKRRPAPAVATTMRARKPGLILLQARLPGVSEPVAAIALGGLQALLRTAEAKMMLLTPVIMTPIFGTMLWGLRHEVPHAARPLCAIAAMSIVLLGVVPLMANQFGFDRDGLRVFVLCAASRRDILLGKDLAFAPVALGMAVVLLALVQIALPMPADHFLAMFPQYVSMYLIFAMVTNMLSIYAPFPVAPGSLKSSNPKLTTVLLQLAMIMFVMPLTQMPTLLPLGIEAVSRFLEWNSAAPICLVLTLAECAIVVVLYRFVLEWQGRLLQAREQTILETVTSRAP